MNRSPISLFTQFALPPWLCPDSFPFSGGSFEEKKEKKKKKGKPSFLDWVNNKGN
jgi:hypothetical protein